MKIIARESGTDERILRSRSERIVQSLQDLGMSHAVGIPDNCSRIIYELLEVETRVEVVRVCREGEAWAVASGLWIGGKQPVVIIQNTGFLESGDALRGTAVEMGVPLVTLIDYRGHHTLSQPRPEIVDSAARLFEPTLRAWEVPYHFLKDGEEARILRAALQEAQRLCKPVGVLMT